MCVREVSILMAAVVHIQARLGSTRLPGKVLYPLGGRRVLGWVVERARHAERAGDIILTVGDRPENDAIREWCERHDVSYDTAPEDDLLERHYQAALTANSDPVVRVTGDCPFVPPSEIDRVIEEHEQNNSRYTTNVTDEMPIGTAVDVIDRDVLEELRELGDSHPVRRLRENPEEWAVAVTPNDQWTAVGEAHTAVDTPADYWQLVDAVKTVGTEPRAVTDWIAER
jgi:spore coat polysaccharide biosynthesis protein SpsF